jgi:signal transduction histidine kinase
MKKRVILLSGFLLVFLTFFCSQVAAADPLTIKVGIYENSPKVFTDENGNASGFWPELISEIAAREGWHIEYVKGSWSECLQRLKNGEIDMLPDVAFTAERGNAYEFSKEIVYTSWTRVYARKSSGIQSILDLEGKVVAVLKGSINVEGPDGIKQLVKAFGINCTFFEIDSYAHVFGMVETGGADAGVVSKDFGYSHEAEFHLSETPIIFQPSHLYFAFPKGAGQTPQLIERIDQNIKYLKAAGNSAYYLALKKWLAEQTVEKSVMPVWVIWMLSGIGSLVILLAGGSLILRARVKAKTRELTEEINRRIQAEKALEIYQKDLEDLVRQRTRELEQANLYKSRFLANMSHELRTPLNSIIGYTKLMLDGLEGSVSDEQKSDLQIVYNNSRHLQSLINDLLDLSKIEAGKIEIIKEKFEPAELISKVIPGMEKLAGDKGLALNYSVSPGLNYLIADKNKTKQVLFNLLGNAIKFTDQGSVSLSISQNEKEFRFSVADTGIGIAKQDIESLFTSYKQVGPARLDSQEGTGLGLIISKQFVEMQGGKIWVESTPGKGSNFTFTLPRN